MRKPVSRRRKRAAFGMAAAVLAGLAFTWSPQANAQAAPGADARAPHFVAREGRHALFVDGAPYLMLGAQPNNSSNWPGMLDQVWPAIADLHANTLEMPVAWEQIEPVEGQFDFSWVDTLVRAARAHNVHLVLLWFGTWKNTTPNYAPAWVKLDNQRFPRMVGENGNVANVLSPNFQATLEADRRAFVALMRHLREIDASRHTVILVQVENEAGAMGPVRDYSPTAQAQFEGAVPASLCEGLHRACGTWHQVFGAGADETFAAWSIASYVEQVAAAGRAEFDLPMYANAALRDPVHEQDPHSYNSGGPTWNMLDVWRIGAPHIDAYAPSMYSRDAATFLANIDRYARPDNPLMIAEVGTFGSYARFLFPVLGRGGLGFSPFGADYTGYSIYPLGAPEITKETLAPFARLNAVLAPMARDWASISFAHPTWGVAKPDDGSPQTIEAGRWRIRVQYDEWQFGFRSWTWAGPIGPPPQDGQLSGGALIAQLGPDEFLVIGQQARVSFELRDPASAHGVLFDRVEEGAFDSGHWTALRRWNGDETDYGLNFVEDPKVLRVTLGTY